MHESNGHAAFSYAAGNALETEADFSARIIDAIMSAKRLRGPRAQRSADVGLDSK